MCGVECTQNVMLKSVSYNNYYAPITVMTAYSPHQDNAGRVFLPFTHRRAFDFVGDSLLGHLIYILWTHSFDWVLDKLVRLRSFEDFLHNLLVSQLIDWLWF